MNPQYAYGWAVPFLCLYLIWRRVENRADIIAGAGCPRRPDSPHSGFSGLQLLGGYLLAFLYAPIWLVQAANPGWSLATWPLALITLGLTLLLLAPLTQFTSRVNFSDLIFPLCFFLIAVPWPFALEQPVVQGLTRLNTALTVEILGVLGILAVPQGNVIELATGSVGIEEACSGIRSLQATFMISLFLGEYRRLSVSRRVICVVLGAVLAMVCNLGRTLLLCWVAANRGVPAIASWHDPAGITILVACFLGVWALSWALQKAPPEEIGGAVPNTPALDAPPTDGGQPFTTERTCIRPSPIRLDSCVSGFQKFSVFLGVWLLLVEIGVAGWYWHIEGNLPTQATWHIAWPQTNSVCRDIPIARRSAEMLRYDDGRQVQWEADDGTRWQLSWFYWKPGQAAAYLARTHNPTICMPAAGYKASMVLAPQSADVKGLRFPYRIYGFEESGKQVYILYSRWEDRAAEQSFATEGVTRFNRLRSIRTGRGNQGQRVISLALWTNEGAQWATDRLLRQLEDLLVVGPQTDP